MGHSDGFALVLKFDNVEPEFAYGFECGRVWGLLQMYPASEINEIMHSENAEMILRMAEATKRRVIATSISEIHVEVVFQPSEN